MASVVQQGDNATFLPKTILSAWLWIDFPITRNCVTRGLQILLERNLLTHLQGYLYVAVTSQIRHTAVAIETVTYTPADGIIHMVDYQCDWPFLSVIHYSAIRYHHITCVCYLYICISLKMVICFFLFMLSYVDNVEILVLKFETRYFPTIRTFKKHPGTTKYLRYMCTLSLWVSKCFICIVSCWDECYLSDPQEQTQLPNSTSLFTFPVGLK